MSNPLDALLPCIIAGIEAGTPPWRQPWKNGGSPGNPLRSDGQPFSGSNAWLLAMVGSLRGFASPYFLTFKQALDAGGHVRKGEKATPALLYRTAVKEGEAEGPDGVPGDPKVSRFLKGYAVFNADQCDGLPDHFLRAPPVDEDLRAAVRVSALEAVPARVVHGGDVACFVPSTDVVRMPPAEAFTDAAAYQATLGHELVHWTGHESRLARTFGTTMRSPAYAAEELVAELGTVLLGLRLGLNPGATVDPAHVSYLAHWSQMFKDRPAALIHASAQAQKAVDLLLSYSQAAAAAAAVDVAA